MKWNQKREFRLWTWIFIILGIEALLLLVLFCGGCADNSFGLRFQASEAQKESAELTYLLAKKVNEQGSDPQSDVSRKIVNGTETSLIYVGRPKQMPDVAEFDTINEQAGLDAAERPDVGGILDAVLELGLGITAVLGGAGGVKLAQSLRNMHAKAKGFTEVVKNNEVFKGLCPPEMWEMFKDAQAQQSEPTRMLVAETKTK
uniref:Uncharacterized protein n=1 Tax=viral metagenome TaxID=1070528 RepID=A0A6M3KQQ4_9ZZZZ